MKEFTLDVSLCHSNDDFYDLLLSVLQAPSWHGHNLDALWDSIRSDINNVLPPYIIDVINVAAAPDEVSQLVLKIQSLFNEVRELEGLEVSFKVG